MESPFQIMFYLRLLNTLYDSNKEKDKAVFLLTDWLIDLITG